MDYDSAMEYLGQTMKFGSRLGLERMAELMDLLGQPGQDIPCIHIAGTNGKGSVTTMTAGILAASGRRVGVYTSPYLHRFTERIRVIDGAKGLENLHDDESSGEISKEATAECITQVKAAVDRITGAGRDHPTEFEIVTAAAFLHFRNARCDFMVLETGLGGRLDSTNVIRTPVKCVITAIGFDHMDRLGNTIEEISAEKAGIIKRGCRVVMLQPGDYSDPVNAQKILGVFMDKAQETDTLPIHFTGKSDITHGTYSLNGQSFTLRLYNRNSGRYRRTRISTSLLGTFQPMNCALAAAACADLADISDIVRGITLSRWPGRMEVLRKKGPTVILDGAHNTQGASALRESLDLFFPGKKIIFLCGVMRDKDYGTLLRTVFESRQFSIAGIYCTKPDNPRALPSEDLAACISEILDNLPSSGYNGLVSIFCRDDVAGITQEALSAARSADAVMVVFGSLYMAGIVRDTVLLDDGMDGGTRYRG
ncbi:MAG: bifunctional folylpolyglutamate synthase/dihydrofolate synthase [Saccharofermentanales bacterium]